MPPKAKTEEQRLQARRAILDAARDLFAEQGVDTVTMRAIARRVDLSATAIYLHFSDKESLIRELCDTDFIALTKELKAIQQIHDPIERLRQLGTAYAHFALAYPNHYRLMFMTPQLACSVEKSGRERGNAEQDAYAGLQQMVSSAHAAGCFRLELDDPELIAQTLWATIHGVCALEITLRNGNWVDWRPFERRLELAQHAVLSGLLREAA